MGELDFEKWLWLSGCGIGEKQTKMINLKVMTWEGGWPTRGVKRHSQIVICPQKTSYAEMNV